MNNDQSNDRTEDFLRRNLGDYSDNPPESVWEGLAGRLSPPPAPVPAPPRWTLHYWMATVIAVLSIGLVAEFWYFNRRIEQLHHEMQQQAPAPSPTPGPVAVTPGSAATPHSSTITAPAAPRPVQPSPIESSASTPDSRPAPRLTDRVVPPAATALPTTPTSGVSPAMVTPPEALTAASVTGSRAADTVQTSIPDVAPTPPPPRVATLPARPAGNLATHPRVLLAPRMPDLIRPVMSRWSVEAVAMPLNTRQNIEADDSWSAPSPGPGSGWPRPAVDEGTKTGEGWRAGIVTSYALNRGWSVISGVTLRQTEQQSVFKPRLRFMDSEPHHHGHGNPGPGQGHDRYEFTYTGFGGNSASEVTFRVESNDPHPSSSPSPHRPLDIEIRTRNEASYIEVPLALQYQVRFGRWTPFVRAGAMGSFLTNTSNELDKITVNDTEFSIEPDYAPRIRPQPLAQKKLSMLGATGLQFQLSRRIGLKAECWWTRQVAGSAYVSGNTWFSPPRVTESTLGLGLGIAYRL